MKKTLSLFSAALFLVAACGAQQEAQETADVSTPETEEEKQLYAIGLSVAGNTLGTFKGEFNEDEVALIAAGFADGMLETEAKVDMEEYGPKLNAYLQQRFQNVQQRVAAAQDHQCPERDRYYHVFVGSSRAGSGQWLYSRQPS